VSVETILNLIVCFNRRISELTASRARLSIGLPVFNGEKYIKEAIDSILAQSFSDFELIISDNASTDHTEQICREYVIRDSRIKYYRNLKNMGASYNHNRVFILSSGEYFKWAAYDDVLGKDFLLKCIEFLDKNPSMVLCSSKTGRINEKSEFQDIYEFKVRINSSKPHERFHDFIEMRNHAWLLLFGVIRSGSLRKTRLFGNYIGTDTNLIAELSLLGSMFEIPEVLFFRRYHSQSYTETTGQDYKERLSWWVVSGSPKYIFPYWRICQEYIRSVRHIPMKQSESLNCYLQIVKYLIKEGFILMSIDVALVLVGHSRLHRTLTPFGRQLYKLAIKR